MAVSLIQVESISATPNCSKTERKISSRRSHHLHDHHRRHCCLLLLERARGIQSMSSVYHFVVQFLCNFSPVSPSFRASSRIVSWQTFLVFLYSKSLDDSSPMRPFLPVFSSSFVNIQPLSMFLLRYPLYCFL